MRPTQRCRIEKMGAWHPAHMNNPQEYPVGWWYITNDPSELQAGWKEAAAETWTEALDIAQNSQNTA